MNIEEVIGSMLNGEPLHDGIIIGIIFLCFFTFYNAIFNGIFTIFNKNK